MQGKGSVEGLKDKLYSRTAKDEPVTRAPLAHAAADAPKAWEPPAGDNTERRARLITPLPAPRPSLAKKFFWGSAAFFVLAMGAAGYFFFGGANFISPQNIELQIIAPSLIDGGTEAQLQFIITNRNTAELQLVDLIIDYPDGTRAPDNAAPLQHERQSLGTISSGRQIKQTSSAVFYGAEGSTQVLRVALEYSVAGSNAVFVKEAETTFTIGSSPVTVAVETPESVVAGQTFDMVVRVQSNAAAPVENVVVEAQYPFGFSVISATPRAASGSTLWRLGTMAPGTTQTIRLRGSIDGQDGDERIFRFLAGSDADETNTRLEVPFLSVPTSVTVRRPFVAGTIAINGTSGKVIPAQAGKQLQGSIVWRNNLGEAVRDVEVILKITGPALDRASVSGGSGFYQSADGTITWTKSQDPSLASVSPGGSGTLQFSLATLQPGSGGTIYTNPTIGLSLTVRGVRQGSDGSQEEVSSVASSDITLASQATLEVAATKLSGSLVAEQESIHAITWSVKNSSNTLANGSVSAVLPPHATFIAGAEGITYDTGSRTVRWTLGDIKAGVGYTSAARQATFQVRVLPSMSQVGAPLPLTGAAALVAQDRFAQVSVEAAAEAPSTVDSVGAKQ